MSIQAEDHCCPSLVRAMMLGTAAAGSFTTAALVSAGAWSWALVCGLLTSVPGLTVVTSLTLARTLMIVTVRGSSMEPAYSDGDRVLVRRSRRLTVGDVVVVEQRPTHRAPDRLMPHRTKATEPLWILKRVDAIPGDPVPRDRIPALANETDHHVPSGKLVLLGDNCDVSLDSRHLGYFHAEHVLGAVVRRLSPSRRQAIVAPTSLRKS
jgi:signal peptidase I